MKLTRLLALTAFALPVLAHAHPGHEGHELTWDFTSGAIHPLSGWDHLLAMTAVGLWAAQLGGRNRWFVPAAFVGVMTLGALLGHAGLAIAGVEQGIAASILVLGLLIACAVKLPTGASMAIVGVFALFHGVAHGAEMPATASGLSYGIGFIVSTTFLHIAGLGLGMALKNQEKVARFAGGAVAVAGALAFAL
ncbi:MAG TPA: HupE/UreJ family protein [Lacunisphaera sp.]|jgi:urease accessory protein